MTRSPQPFWVVGKGDTLSGVVKSALGVNDSAALAIKVKELARLNSHLESADKVHPGQVIYLGPPGGVATVRIHGEDLREMSRIFTDPSSTTAQLVANWDTLAVLEYEMQAQTTSPVLDSMNYSPAQLANAMGASSADASPNFLYATKWANRLAKSANKVATHAIKGKMGNLFNVSPHIWRKVEGEYVKSFNRHVRYLRNGNVATMVPKNARAFQMAGRTILVQPDKSTFRAFSSKVAATKKIAKDILGPAGKVFKVIDLGLAASTIYGDRNSPTALKTAMRETSKVALGLGTAGISSAAAGGICVGLTFTTGPGGIACFFVASVGVSWSISTVAGTVSDGIYDLFSSKFFLGGP